MPKDKLFEKFNAVKQQITQIVEDNSKQSLELSKDSAIKEPSPGAPSVSSSADSSTQSDSTSENFGDDNSNDPDSNEDGVNADEFDIDSEDNDDESDKDNDPETSPTQESYVLNEYNTEAMDLCLKIDLGFEQIKILSTCFDADGDLLLSQESYSAVKSTSWVTGHQLFLGDKPPKSNMDVYYASESLRETLANIMNWLIEKIKQLIEWVYTTATMLNDTFSTDAMYDRFKTGFSSADKQQSLDELLPEYNRIKSLLDELDKHSSQAHAKVSEIIRQASAKPETKLLLDQLTTHVGYLTKSVKRYKESELDIELGTTIDMSAYSSIINGDSIKDASDLFNILKDAGQASMNLRQIALVYQHQFEDFSRNSIKFKDIMLTNPTSDPDKYMDDTTRMLDQVLDRLKSDAQSVLNSCTYASKSIDKESNSKTYGQVNLTTTHYNINMYGQVHVELNDVTYTKADFLKIEDSLHSSVDATSVNDFKTAVSSYYNSYMSTMSAYSSFKCYAANKQTEVKPYSAYKDPTSAGAFYKTYKEAIMYMGSGIFDDTIKAVNSGVKSVTAEASRAKQMTKQLQPHISDYARKNINLLSVFSDKPESTYISLQEHIKKLIAQSYTQLYTYTNVRPMVNAMLCYKNAKLILDKNAQLFADLARPVSKLEKTFSFFMKLNKTVILNSYEIKKAAQALIDADIDATYYLDMANDNIQKWAEVFKHSIDVKRKTF